MKQRTIPYATLLILVWLLSSCFNVPKHPLPDCAEVTEPKLSAFPFDQSAAAAATWIQYEYGLTAKEIEGNPSADGTQDTLRWRVEQRRYTVTLWSDVRESALIWVEWPDRALTLADTLRCLGDPSLYRAYYSWNPEAVWTYLELWYPERGLMVTAYATRKISGFPDNEVVNRTSYVQPGQPEELIPRFFLALAPGSDRYTQILHGLKLWPGSIEDITIDDRG